MNNNLYKTLFMIGLLLMMPICFGGVAATGSKWWPSNYADKGEVLESTGVYGDAILTAAQYAVIAYFGAQMIGGLLGWSEGQTNALSYGLATGAGVYGAFSGGAFGGLGAVEGQGIGGFFAKGSWTGGAAPIALAAAIIVFVATYEDVEIDYQVVNFECNPWEAPDGGENCEVCQDGDLPCSEYRCKSLGKDCQLVNEGTGDEKCVAASPRDVIPPIIKPNYDEISLNHEYRNVKLSPPGPGFNIVYLNSDDGCLDAFTPLEFGLILDEPAQCKVDMEKKDTYEEMDYFFGGSNLFKYNHTERFSLPGIANLASENITLPNGGDFVFYIRCKDYNGNTNDAAYAVGLCVDDSPDTTPPQIIANSVEEGSCVANNEDSSGVNFYLNEPSECRWSFTDKDYNSMENQMSCATSTTTVTNINGLNTYKCSTELTGIAHDGTDYFIRCKDQPLETNDNDRNSMKVSTKFSLRGSDNLRIDFVKPNSTIYGGVDPAPVEFYVETSYGCDSGKAVCSYSETGEEGDYILFADTNKEDGIHTQRLNLGDGTYKYYIQCVDAGGNAAVSTINFKVDIQTNAPSVARFYEEDNLLKIITTRDSECVYTTEDCNFMFDEGLEMPPSNSTTHVVEWNKEETYYIKCKDEFRSEGAQCSVIIKPTDNFLA